MPKEINLFIVTGKIEAEYFGLTWLLFHLDEWAKVDK